MRMIFISLTAISLLMVSCQTKSKSSGSLSGTASSGGSSGTDLSSIFGGSGTNGTGTVSVGSAADGGLTEADKNAAKNLIAETDSIAPQDGGVGLSPELLAQAKALMEQERQGKDVSAQKIALAGQIMNACVSSKKYLVREPFAGQPLMGTWSQSSGCGVQFTVSANPDPDVAAYPVSGNTEGQLVAQTDGTAKVQAQPWSGSVKDTPSANGTLRHPSYFPTKYGADPCDSAVKLDSSTNPIPENFKEGVKIQAQCQRQALFILSPVMDDLFQSMNGDMAKVLQQRVLGIQ